MNHMMSRAALAACVLALVPATACMLTPTDEREVRNRSESLQFVGYHLYPDEVVQVEAFNFTTRRFERIASARSETTSSAAATGFKEDVYYWSAGRRTLATSYWSPGLCRGY